MKTPFRLANYHPTCQQCLYAFEIDTYGRGCVHDCAYCYAKAELTVHGYWNNPPAPVDINEIRKAFYITFETQRPHKWRDFLARRIPIRIGSMSDAFMWLDKTYRLTHEFLQILRFYRYPYIIFTRSDLVAEDEYLCLLEPNLASIQMSISSTNEKLTRAIEPGAPSPRRRLLALRKLVNAGLWTTVRINPIFPIFPDGYFTDPAFTWQGDVPKFEFTSFEMVDEIAQCGTPAIIAGFGRFSRLSLNAVERATGFNLRQFYRRDLVEKSWRDYHFTDREIRFYYEQIRARCIEKNIQFTTCYIGNGEEHFWKDQDIWSNRKDCCNAKGRIPAFGSDTREIPFESRLRFTQHKQATPLSGRLHDELGTD